MKWKENPSGVWFIPLWNDKSRKLGNPFKSSLFGKAVGLDVGNTSKSQRKLSRTKGQKELKGRLLRLWNHITTVQGLKKELLNIISGVLFRTNNEGRIYVQTFIDHEQKVFNWPSFREMSWRMCSTIYSMVSSNTNRYNASTTRNSHLNHSMFPTRMMIQASAAYSVCCRLKFTERIDVKKLAMQGKKKKRKQKRL